MKNIAYVNGRDIGADFGFAIRRIVGLGAQVTFDGSNEVVLGRAGVLRDVGYVPMAARTLRLLGAFASSDVNTLRTNVSEFFRWVRHGELHEIETILYPGKIAFGRLIASDVDWMALASISRFSDDGAIEFRMHAPVLYDKYPGMYSGAPNTRVQPALGNFASTPDIYLYHPSGVVNPTLSLYRANGTLVKTVTFTTTLSADDYLMQNNEDLSVTLVTAGSAANAPSIAPSGDPFFILDPADGDPVNGLFPYFISTNAYVQVGVRKVYMA